MQQYYIDMGVYPGTIPSTLTEICNTGSASGTTTSVTGAYCGTLVNLSDLVPTYMVAIPTNPQSSPVALLTKVAEAATIGTGYLVGKNTSNKITVRNLRTELNVTITYGPESSQAYDVIFDANSGTGSMSNLTIASGTSQALTTNTLTRTNYTFTSWNTAANGSGTAYADAASFTMHGGNVTLYAQWSQNATAPTAPTIGTATAGNATATVAFTPNSDGGSSVLYYTITSIPGSITASGASSPITVTGLTNGTGYTFTVTATNIVGTSTASAATNPAVTPSAPFSATGGTVTTGVGYKYHTFTSSGSFIVSGASSNVEVLVVAGGGAGGLVYNSSYTVSAGTLSVVVGGGGVGKMANPPPYLGVSGSNSSFDQMIAVGGGGGASWVGVNGTGGPGGSGGGGGDEQSVTHPGGAATQGNSGGGTGYGYAGGNSYGYGIYSPGGGGAGAVGGNGSNSKGGDGGVGRQYSQFSSVGGSPAGWFAGGGGGGGNNSGASGKGVGASGGGGDGAIYNGATCTSGADNTGGGGGGLPNNGNPGCSGGSGIVIVRYAL